MKPIHNGLKRIGSLIKICTFLILSSIYLISTAFTTSPGTYAWFSSETSASGSIQNATTEDLLEIQASEIQYGSNCSIENTLTVKNLSDMSTEVNIFVQSVSGEELLKSQKLKPGQSLTTAPDAITDMTGGCEATSFTYHIRGFINYVDETYSVEVDQTELKETMIPKEEESKEEEKPTKEEQQKDQDETNVDEPAESQEETTAKDEEEVQPPTDEDPEQDEQGVDQPQTEEGAESNEQPEENKGAVEEASKENQYMEVEEEAEPGDSIASE